MVLCLFACTPDGDHHAVEVDEDGSVSDLKKSASRALGIPPQSVEVVFDEEVLCDGMFLSDTALSEECCVQVVNRKYQAMRELQTQGIAVSPRSLLESAKSGKLDILKLHLAAGIDSSSRSSFGGTPLLAAATEGRVDVVEYLIHEFPSQLEAANCLGETPLIAAVDNCHPAVVKMLLAAGVDPNESDRLGCTPILACAIAHVGASKKIVKKQEVILDHLLSAGGDPTVTNSDGETPSTILQRCNNTHGVNAINTILAKKKELALSELQKSNVTLSPRSMLQCAESGHVQHLRLHIDAGLPASTTSSFGHSLLYIACSNGKTGVVQFLADKYKALVDSPSEDLQETPLLEATRKGFVKIVKILLKAGANPNKADIYGLTPLMAAAGGGHIQVVRCLLDAGAQVHKPDKDGVTAMDVANSLRCTKISDLLKKATQS